MYESIETLCRDSAEQKVALWKLIQKEDCREEGIDEDESFARMKELYKAMQKSDAVYDPALRSRSGLVGGEAEKVRVRRQEGKLLVGDFMGRMMERALRVAESNACMKRIVAAPTAGSCGVVPAVLLTLQEEKNYTDEQMTEALYVAAGIGGVIASRASLSGAEGGCQAEIGSASSMAASAAAYLCGGDSIQIASAAALAMKGLLGLACDPVAGLVEVPCVKRNVVGCVNAVTSADMAMAGIVSKIAPDQVFDAMRTIGRSMSADIRETGKGGLAATPDGEAIREQMEA